MKKTILICYAFLCVMITDAVPSSHSINNVDKEEIELRGSLQPNGPKSAIRPIQAFIDISELDIDFLHVAGNIDVKVYDEAGNVVYQKTVSTHTEDHLSIDISAWNPGNYEIRFIGSEDQFMYGEFEID